MKKKSKKTNSIPPNTGKKYEKFIHDSLKDHLLGFEFQFDEKILGLNSKTKRQIDISIRGKVGNADIFYAVECKNRSRICNVQSVDSFSSFLKDVGASKGILMSSKGFTSKLYIYAQSVGIELLSIEDINSPDWNIKIEVPIVYIRKNAEGFTAHVDVIVNTDFVERNKSDVTITEKDFSHITLDRGATFVAISDYINMKLRDNNIDLSKLPELILDDPNLQIRVGGILVNARYTIIFEHSSEMYLKYIIPEEYKQLTDHISNTVSPLHFQTRVKELIFDESYYKITSTEIPVRPAIMLEVEELIDSIAGLTFSGFS